MFELERSSLFFEQLSKEHPTILQNIEIVNENKIALDGSYHQPKHFILNLNNLLRSLLFFTEFSAKNSPDWLKIAVESFIKKNDDAYQILRHLRNVSAHQKLIFPEEALVSGLYRIKSSKDYLLKLGFGEHNGPGKYAWDLAFKDTSEIFHDMLAFASVTFMDLEHSAIGECLGITRRWYFKVNFKTATKRYNEVSDVYDLAASFSTHLLDHVCQAYAMKLGVKYQYTFVLDLKEHNYINTLLEIDLFPGLFTKWWDEECQPLNFGVRRALAEAQTYESSDQFHKWVFENLTPNVAAYRSSLKRFADLEPDVIFESDNFADFLSFIVTNQWHYKKAFESADSFIDIADVMQLQRLGDIFMSEYRKEKLCTIMSTKQNLNKLILKLIEKIDEKQGAN